MTWRAFPLHPETPEEGLLIEKLFAGMPVNIDDMMAGLKKTAADLGLPFGDRKKTYNSRLAQELGLWAETRDRGDAFHMEAFKAYFVHGRNIAKASVLVELAESVGLSGKEAGMVIAERSFREQVDADWALSKEKEICAVPSFVMGTDKLVGAQSYAVLEKFAVSHRARKK